MSRRAEAAARKRNHAEALRAWQRSFPLDCTDEFDGICRCKIIAPKGRKGSAMTASKRTTKPATKVAAITDYFRAGGAALKAAAASGDEAAVAEVARRKANRSK